jgi:4-diphosphocytidyl-2-C-methyl-D-erythritol kinase
VTRPVRVLVSAPAKINLCLHVGDRGADGYHALESLVAFALHGDEMLLDAANGLSLAVTGTFASNLLAEGDNLVIKAARLLAERANVRAGARIAMKKEIPVASGLGGGSADAAAALRGLATLWGVDPDGDMLRAIAPSLGADVPVCLESAPAWIEGRGERVTLMPSIPPTPVLLVNPGVPVPTASVFAGLRQRRGIGMDCPRVLPGDVHALVAFLQSTTNDLAIPARDAAPAIGDVLDEIARLPNALLARMSGSGATCFGIFENRDLACAAGAALRARRPDWWIVATVLAPARIGTPALDQ